MSVHRGEASRQDRERAHFDRLADETGGVWWGHRTPAGKHRLRERARRFLSHLDAVAGRDPLCVELGCGTGSFSDEVLRDRPYLRLAGVDISPRCVDVARQRLASYERAEVRAGDVTRLPFADGEADVVFGNAVLHHFPFEQALREARRLLRRGGLLWFSEPNLLNPQVALQLRVRPLGRLLDVSDDETAFRRGDLEERLMMAGFEQVRVQPYDWLHPGLPRPLIPAGKLASAVLGRLPVVREISGSLEVSARRR